MVELPDAPSPWDYILRRLDDIGNRASGADARIAALEAVVADKFAAITAEHKRLTTRLNWVLGAILVTCFVDMFGSSEAYRIFIRLMMAMLR